MKFVAGANSIPQRLAHARKAVLSASLGKHQQEVDMKRAKRALQVVMAGASAALVVGCEALSFDGAPAAAPTADEVAMASVTRQRVQAELREAQRLGLITVGEESPRVMTAEEVRLVAEAGEAAATAQAHAPKAK